MKELKWRVEQTSRDIDIFSYLQHFYLVVSNLIQLLITKLKVF